MTESRRRFLVYGLSIACAATPLLAFPYVLSESYGEWRRALLAGICLYWLIPAILVLGFFTRFLPGRPSSARPLPLPAAAAGAALAAMLTLLATMAFPPQPRVQWDEADLLNTSVAMAIQHSALTPVMAVPAPEGFRPVELHISPRPALFPFTVSVAHSLLSPSPRNPLRVNLALLWAFLFGLFAVMYRHADLLTALAAPLLVSSVPLLFWVGTSGGMDFASLCAVTALAAGAVRFLENSSARSFAVVVVIGAIAAHSRYETAGLVLPLAAYCAWRGRRAGIPWTLLLPPLALLPAVLFPLFLQYHGSRMSFMASGAKPTLSPLHVPANLFSFVKVFFAPLTGIHNGPLNLAAVVLLGFAAARRRLPAILAVPAACALYPLLVSLSFFDGDPALMQSARLYLVPAVALALAPLLVRSLWSDRRAGAALLAFSALAFASSWASTAGTKLLPDSLDTLNAESILGFAGRERRPGDLYVFDPPSLLLSGGHFGVSSVWFAGHPEEVAELRRSGALRRTFWIRSGAEFPVPGIEEAWRRIEAEYSKREAARFPQHPYPLVIYELGQRP